MSEIAANPSRNEMTTESIIVCSKSINSNETSGECCKDGLIISINVCTRTAQDFWTSVSIRYDNLKHLGHASEDAYE